jgi:hypothetical protein
MCCCRIFNPRAEHSNSTVLQITHYTHTTRLCTEIREHAAQPPDTVRSGRHTGMTKLQVGTNVYMIHNKAHVTDVQRYLPHLPQSKMHVTRHTQSYQIHRTTTSPVNGPTLNLASVSVVGYNASASSHCSGIRQQRNYVRKPGYSAPQGNCKKNKKTTTVALHRNGKQPWWCSLAGRRLRMPLETPAAAGLASCG